MPRKPRIEANDAIYHVINRGNYRSTIFETDRAKDAFRATLFEACERFGWQLSAYCILGNHYHLCLSTPMGNLSYGMKWLQGTYATRFNRYRNESGHLFQGRFNSLIVEPGHGWIRLVDYIHLNPVRAGLAAFEALLKYPWSSYGLFPKRSARPSFFDTTWMAYAEDLSDTRGGWVRYRNHLKSKETVDPKEAEALEKEMCRGWCIGSDDFRKDLAKEKMARPGAIRLDRDELASINREHWESVLEKCLAALGKTRQDARDAKKSEDWKLAIACRLRSSTSASNAWLTEQLYLGTPRAVSAICGLYQRDRQNDCPHYAKLQKLTFDA